MARPARHIWRLLKWGRTLAKHGALRGIERDPNTPPPVKRLARIARFGTVQPKEPDYAGAFRDIGPAAIKLGQTLATRPDLVGELTVAELAAEPVAVVLNGLAGAAGLPATLAALRTGNSDQFDAAAVLLQTRFDFPLYGFFDEFDFLKICQFSRH